MRASLRWLVPIAVTAAVATGAAVATADAGSTPDLPSRTPQQVLEAVAASDVRALSGTVVTHSDLGLPSIDQLGAAGGQSSGRGLDAADAAGLATRFLAGRNTLRVWGDGPTRVKVQLLDTLDELDVIRNGNDLWTYAARRDQVGHATLTGPATRTAPATPATALTPADLARRALAAAGPSTSVTLADPQVVAGRSTYTLRLTPTTSATLVGRVDIAVDGSNGVPLKVTVVPRGRTAPAIETGFTAVSFATPPASTFAFTPPKGATVVPLGGKAGASAPAAPAAPSKPAGARPTVTGTGWASIVEMPATTPGAKGGPTGGTAGTTGSSSSSPTGTGPASLLDGLTTPVSGGRALSSSLVSVLLTDDGRVLAGAVPVDALVAAARR